MNETKIVNLRLEKCDVKITRTPKNQIPEPPNFGCFGNPYFLKDVNNEEERAEVVSKYKIYFYNRIKKDEAFKNAVLDLKGKKLGCFCKQPNKEVACHGDIIKEWLDNQGKNNE